MFHTPSGGCTWGMGGGLEGLRSTEHLNLGYKLAARKYCVCLCVERVCPHQYLSATRAVRVRECADAASLEPRGTIRPSICNSERCGRGEMILSEVATASGRDERVVV
jgi:hypothetical protein